MITVDTHTPLLATHTHWDPSCAHRDTGPHPRPQPSALATFKPELGNLHLTVVLRRVSGPLLLGSGPAIPEA